MNTTPRAGMSTAPASSSQYSRFVPLLESPRTLGIKASRGKTAPPCAESAETIVAKFGNWIPYISRGAS